MDKRPEVFMSAGFTNLITGSIFITSYNILLESIKYLTRKSPSRCFIINFSVAAWVIIVLPMYIIVPAS